MQGGGGVTNHGGVKEHLLLAHLLTGPLSLFQASEEEEIVDLMLMKLFGFFGIKCKQEEKTGCNDQPKQPVSN